MRALQVEFGEYRGCFWLAERKFIGRRQWWTMGGNCGEPQRWAVGQLWSVSWLQLKVYGELKKC